MKNIKIETNYVRVTGNTYDPNEIEMNEMIGQELEVRSSDYEDNTIYVWDKYKSSSYYFNKEDVRFLTPAMFKEKHIAIDDEVLIDSDWDKVLGFYMYDFGIRVIAGTPENTFDILESDIKDHRTGITETPETKMTIAQIEEKLNLAKLVIIE